MNFSRRLLLVREFSSTSICMNNLSLRAHTRPWHEKLDRVCNALCRRKQNNVWKAASAYEVRDGVQGDMRASGEVGRVMSGCDDAGERDMSHVMTAGGMKRYEVERWRSTKTFFISEITYTSIVFVLCICDFLPNINMVSESSFHIPLWKSADPTSCGVWKKSS